MRPEGWKQPDTFCKLANVECISKLDAYEAGADAMHRADVEELKKEDARMYTGTLDNPDVRIIKVHKDFWQAFISEEE